MKYVVKKVGILILMLVLVSFITFIAFSAIPGDSVITALGTEATEEAIEAMREEMGYNDSILIRYGRWAIGVLKGEFGDSFQYKMIVSELVGDKLPVTLTLAFMSILLTVVIAIPLGLWLAKTKNQRLQNLIAFITQMLMSIPSFFLGMILTLLFGVVFKFFTPGGYVSYKEDVVSFLTYLFLPAVAISLPKISMVSKFMLTSVKREMDLDYVRTAYSKGATRNHVFKRHIRKNSMMPVVTFLGMVIAEMLAGSIVVEQVFNIPGLGRLLVTSINNRDLYVVQAIILYIVTVVIVINFVVDMIYQIIDPRVRLK